MRVRLLRSWTNDTNKKYPRGTYLDVTRSLGKKMITERYAMEDNAQYPPKKTKTDIFKPK